MSHKREIADRFLSLFPKASTLMLSRMAYNAHPEVWSKLEATRSYFRRRRGANGVQSRRESKDKSHYRPLQKPDNPFERMPQPLREFDDWGAVEFPGPLRALILSDLHIPYYDREATVCALKYGQELGADTILLNGDIADFFALSSWEKDPRKRDFPREIRDMKDFLRTVRDLFPKARIIYKLGNHEERMIRYMRVKAPELLGLPEFEIESVLGLADNDIQLVKDNRPIKLGSLNIIHGHEYRFAISNPVSPARGLFLKGISNAVCGHFHQSSQHSKRSLEQKVITNWSSGCLCDLHPEYRPMNDWNHGFMVVNIDKHDAFEVGNLRIVNGKAYY
jgi:predicted phosphodiesterase